jgi:hypothetical protein
VHGFAFTLSVTIYQLVPVLVRAVSLYAIALKPTHKAGRRGGDSIAREGCKYICVSLASGKEAGAESENARKRKEKTQQDEFGCACVGYAHV